MKAEASMTDRPDRFDRAIDESPHIMPEDVLAVVQRQRVTRRDVARAYHLLLVEHTGHLGTLSMAEVNHAIIKRWSISGLNWIKQQAWRVEAP